jgi:hypothetical protein
VPYDGPSPLDALRDLIALTRSLYITFKGTRAFVRELAAKKQAKGK